MIVPSAGSEGRGPSRIANPLWGQLTLFPARFDSESGLSGSPSPVLGRGVRGESR